MREYLVVNRKLVMLDNPERLLAELEFEYCLPKWFWTDREWVRYTIERSKLVRLIRDWSSYLNEARLMEQ